jgi:hypothetical protein
MKLDATRLRDKWAIRPVNQLGTCGCIDGVFWSVTYLECKPYNVLERS